MHNCAMKGTLNKMKILVTGGAGFIGSNISEIYAQKGHEVVVIDNLSRMNLLKKQEKNTDYNWNYLKKYENITARSQDLPPVRNGYLHSLHFNRKIPAYAGMKA